MRIQNTTLVLAFSSALAEHCQRTSRVLNRISNNWSFPFFCYIVRHWELTFIFVKKFMNPKILAVIFSLKLARLVGFEGILGPKSTTPTPTFNLPGLPQKGRAPLFDC